MARAHTPFSRLSLAVVIAALLPARPARACTPWAEQMVGWDVAADVVLVAIWSHRDRPPAAPARPGVHELRRLSTGERLGVHACAQPDDTAATPSPVPPCDFRAAFARWLPPGAQLRSPGSTGPRPSKDERLPGLRVRTVTSAGERGFALEARGSGGWRRVLWLDFDVDRAEQRRYQLGTPVRAGRESILPIQYTAWGSDCPRTVVHTLRLDRDDIVDPGDPGRRARLLARVRKDAAFAHWRTTAAFGPLPPERLLEALEAAELAGQWKWGVRWWREATARVPAGQRAALAAGLAAHPNLPATREALKADKGRADAAP